MNNNLWIMNTPRNFWQFNPDPNEKFWQAAYSKSLHILDLDPKINDIYQVISNCLGEFRFGPNPYKLGKAKHLYYNLKPFMTRGMINWLKRLNASLSEGTFQLGWPIEPRYTQFQWEVSSQILKSMGELSTNPNPLWPYGNRFSLVLTHDIETDTGQKFVKEVADLEEDLGFRSSFNFVPEKYKLDLNLIKELRERNFEIGIHGLKHDGKLFHSKKEFMKRAKKINHYLKEFDAVGFRAPLMHRNPYWMQSLEIEYDLSFFDTDPYEPIPGGCMSIWPFFIGKFVELPYTLTQDSTLWQVLGEKTPKIWLDKVAFIEKYHGMALVNSHPDYLIQPGIWHLYVDFLMVMKEKNNFWHALPRELARWWLKRVKPETTEISTDKIKSNIY